MGRKAKNFNVKKKKKSGGWLVLVGGDVEDLGTIYSSLVWVVEWLSG